MEDLEEVPVLNSGSRSPGVSDMDGSDIDIEVVPEPKHEADRVMEHEKAHLPLKEGEYQYVVSSRQAFTVSTCSFWTLDCSHARHRHLDAQRRLSARLKTS
jgi:hypothetical protein